MSERRKSGGAAKSGKTRVRRRDRKNIPRGKGYIRATFNNTIVTLTDPAGNVIAWSSAGSNGFKGSRKSTPYAAQVTAEQAARKAMATAMCLCSIRTTGSSTRSIAHFPSTVASRGMPIAAACSI